MAKSIQQLKKKLQDKSAECELYKRKYAESLLELNKQILENIEMQDVLDEIRFGLRDPHDSLEDSPTTFSEKKEDEKGFSSKFMPNVKFKIPDVLDSVVCGKLILLGVNLDYQYYCTSDEGETLICVTEPWYNDDTTYPYIKRVSMDEAIPELVPEGMVYDDVSDSLVKRDPHKIYGDPIGKVVLKSLEDELTYSEHLEAKKP